MPEIIDETTTRPDDGREPIADTGSLSEHEAEYSSGREPKAPPASVESPEPVTTEEGRDETGRFTPRKHRAKSQEATPSDVATIQALSRELKEAEEAAGLELERKAGESEKVFNLRRRVELAKAYKTRGAAIVSQPTGAAPSSAPAWVPPTVAAPSQPVPDKFVYPAYEAALAKDPNLSYEDWQDQKLEAHADWRDAKRDQVRYTQDQQRSEQEIELLSRQRVNAFAAKTPDFQTKLQTLTAQGYDIPNVVLEACRRSDNGPALLYALLNQPDEMDRLWLANGSTAVTPQTIVAMQRYLTSFASRAQTGPTAAVAPPQFQKRNPAPPTAVRTGSMQTGTKLPDDGSSLAEHEQAFNQRRRR